jgi:hypothetical protein
MSRQFLIIVKLGVIVKLNLLKCISGPSQIPTPNASVAETVRK